MQARKYGREPVSILELKNILARVRDEINMSTLTVAIRQQCLEEQQTHLKDQFLNFFLRCEGKLKRYGNAEWNRVINGEIKKIVGFEKLEICLHHKLVGSAFAKIQRETFVDEQYTVEERLYDEFADLRDMEISEDVKAKTKYFFKWCKFIEEKRAIKKMKNKEIEDLRKSKVFHQYSIKFHTFVGWKQYIRKMQVTKERAMRLEKKTEKSKLLNIFTQIKQKIEIVTIEKLLEEAVESQLESVRIKYVFKKLQASKDAAIDLGESLPKRDNIWLHRFYMFIAQRGLPLMNKTSVAKRKEVAVQYNKICLQTCWKGLKTMTNQTLQKMKKIKTRILKSNLKQFVKLKSQLKSMSKSKKDFKGVLKKSWLLSLFKNIQKKSSAEITFFGREKQVNEKFKNISFSFVLKRLAALRAFKDNLSNKGKKFQLYTDAVARKKVITNLRILMTKKTSTETNVNKIRCQHLINLISRRVKYFKQWKKECTELKTQLSSMHEQKLIKCVWKGFLKVKKMKANELETLTTVVQMLQKKMKAEVFDALEERRFQVNKISRLVKSSEYVVLKVAFITILSRMLSKKKKIRNFAIKQESKLKKMLFGMLLTNTQLMSEARDKVKVVYKLVMKKQLLQRLRQGVRQTATRQQAERILQQKRKGLLFRFMKENTLNRNEFDEKQETCCSLVKGIKLSEFIGSVQELSTHRLDQQRKAIRIKKLVIKNSIKTIRKNMWNFKNRVLVNQEQEQYFDTLIQKIHLNLATSALKTLIRQSDYITNQKIEVLYKHKVSEFTQRLTFNYKQASVQRMIRSSRAEELIARTRDYHTLQKKQRTLKKFVKKIYFVRTISMVNENLKEEEEERLAKVEAVQAALAKTRQRKSKQFMISRIKNHYEIKENMQMLLNLRVRESCKDLVKLYLKQKSESLKEFMALRHYAMKVRSRGMRGLKKLVNFSLLKQNRGHNNENSSKWRVQKSIDNPRKRSKLIETIERYNMSRVSRVIR